MANLAVHRKFTDPRRLSPDLSEFSLARRLAPYPSLYRQESENLRFKPALGRTTSGYGTRTRFIGLTDLKESLAVGRLRPQTIIHDKEQLYEEVLALKADNNLLKTVNRKLGTKLSQLEQELDRRDQLMQQMSAVTGEKQLSALVAETRLVSALKQTIKQLKSDLIAKETACGQLKRSIKLTKAAELEAEAKEYFAECQRLKELIKEGRTARLLTADSDLRRENTELTAALEALRKDAQSLREKVRDSEQAAFLGKSQDTHIQILQQETAALRLEMTGLRSELELKERDKQETTDLYVQLIGEMEEGWRMTREDVRGWETREICKMRQEIREMEDLHEAQTRVLEQDKREGIRALQDICLHILKRKTTRKRLNFSDILSSATVFTAKSLKNALHSAGLKMHKWQIAGLFSGSEALRSLDLLSDYQQTSEPRDLQSAVAQPSFRSDTFSLTSNPFEVSEGSKRSSGFRPALTSLPAHENSSVGKNGNSMKSQPAPTVEDPSNPTTPLFDSSPQGQYFSQFPQEEIPEEPYAYEEYRHELYTEPGGDLMSIAEVRKSLSTDSWDERKGDGGVILLNIDETRVARTFQSIRLRAQLHHLTPEVMKRKLAAHFPDKQLSIDHLKFALQGDQLQVREEADAVAAAAYLLGHRQGLVDTQKLEQVESVDFAALGEWEVLAESEEADLKAQFEGLLSALTFAELQSADTDSTGKVAFPALQSLCNSHHFPLPARLLLYIELQSFAQTHEVGLFPYARFFPKSTENAEALAKECAQHLGTELLIQGLSVSEAFGQGMTQEEFLEKVRSMGLEGVEGMQELLEKVLGPEGLQVAALEKELEEFQSLS